MKIFLLALLLSATVIADPLLLKEAQPPKGLFLPKTSSRVKMMTGSSVLFHSYMSQDGQGMIDIYGPKTEKPWQLLVHLEVPAHWGHGMYSVSYLNSDSKTGWVIWSDDGTVDALAFPVGWEGETVWGGCSPGEFSTTGWSSVGVSEGDGMFGFYVRHEWPGEETEDGRATEGYDDDYVWSFAERRFVLQKDG